MKKSTRAAAWAIVAVVSLVSAPAVAHWCSNIFAAPARLVVKPETTTVHITGGSATLKVYLQNNFPYKLFNMKMAGSASGYTVTVAPAQQDVNPGQNVLFTYTVKGSADVAVSKLNLKVTFRHGTFGESDVRVNQSPTQATLVSYTSGGFGSGPADQVPVLSAATLADRYATAKLSSSKPFFGRTGLQQLIQWFGYRFCYNSSGAWRSSGDCPTPNAEGAAWSGLEQFPQDCLRAGAELGARRVKLGSDLQAAQNGAVNAMKGGGIEHRCMAAVVGGHLWQGAASTTAFETALNALPSAVCKAAGLRALGKGTQSSCGSGTAYEKAACAAAEGLRGNDAVVKSILMAKAGDGDTGGNEALYNAYMLYLVTGDRYASGSSPSYYPQVGPSPDAGTTKSDKGVAKSDKGGPEPDKGPTPMTDAGNPIVPDQGARPDGVAAGDGPAVTGDGQEQGNTADGGCGCVVAGGRSLPWALALPLAFVLFLRRRRRG